MKKALFITHDTSIYGASRSLQTFLKEYEGTEIHLVVRKKFLKKNNFAEINRFFHDKIKEIHEFYLPFDLCFKGKGRNTLPHFIYHLLHLFNQNRFYSFLQSTQFDFIHLNSLVLHPLLREDLPFIIHVREIYDGSNEKVKPSLQRARGVIFIDESTRKPFIQLPLNESIVLNNPIDMTDVFTEQYSDKYLADLTAGKKVFSIIGGISEIKGVDFIIETFVQYSSAHALLLIVGHGHESYIKKCKALAGEDSRVVFLGEEREIKKIYQISDYILRGDPLFCIGRTIFEGLYSGCQVIIPGQPADGAKFFEFQNFKDKIHFYSPRSSASLLNILEGQTFIQKGKKLLKSNLDYHLLNFNKFLKKIGL